MLAASLRSEEVPLSVLSSLSLLSFSRVYGQYQSTLSYGLSCVQKTKRTPHQLLHFRH
jgi:hypothetical protein